MGNRYELFLFDRSVIFGCDDDDELSKLVELLEEKQIEKPNDHLMLMILYSCGAYTIFKIYKSIGF